MLPPQNRYNTAIRVGTSNFLKQFAQQNNIHGDNEKASSLVNNITYSKSVMRKAYRCSDFFNHKVQKVLQKDFPQELLVLLG